MKNVIIAAAIVLASTTAFAADFGNHSDTIRFETEVPVVCGIKATDSSGEVGFERFGRADEAELELITNAKSQMVKVTFTESDRSENLYGEHVNMQAIGTDGKDASHSWQWKLEDGNKQTWSMKAGEPVKLSTSVIYKDKNHITAGIASVDVVVDIQCASK